MRVKLLVNYGDYDTEFSNFASAVSSLELEFDFEGEEWEEVVISKDFEKLCAYLIANDEQAELFID